MRRGLRAQGPLGGRKSTPLSQQQLFAGAAHRMSKRTRAERPPTTSVTKALGRVQNGSSGVNGLMSSRGFPIPPCTRTKSFA
jgi:hypothetical protein